MKANRWIYVIAGVIGMLFVGSVYAWSVFRTPIAAEFPQWSAADLALTFSLCMGLFCIGNLVAGVLNKKLHHRVIGILAAVLTIVGFLIAAQATTLAPLYIGYGILSGLGLGFIYNLVLSIVLRWFPESPGLISGILLMGVGFGPLVAAPVFTTLSQSLGWRGTFIGIGAVAAICFVIVTCILKNPDADQAAPKLQKNTAEVKSSAEEIPPQRMLRSKAFWIYFIWVVLLNSASLGVNSQAYPLAEEVFITTPKAAAMDPVSIASFLALLVSLFSIFNGIGRVAFGRFFDRKGRNLTLLVVSCGFVLSCIILGTSLSTSNFPLVVAGLILLGFTFGALPTMSSAFARDFFGSKNYSINFPLLNMSVFTSSFTGPLLAGNMYDAAGSYEGLLWWLVVLCVVGTFLCLFIRKPGESIKNFKK